MAEENTAVLNEKVDWDALIEEIDASSQMVSLWFNGNGDGQKVRQALGQKAGLAKRLKEFDSGLDGQRTPEEAAQIRKRLAAAFGQVRAFEAEVVITLLRLVKKAGNNGQAGKAKRFREKLRQYFNSFPEIKAMLRQDLGLDKTVTTGTGGQPTSSSDKATSSQERPWTSENEIEFLAELPTLDLLIARFEEVLQGFRTGTSKSKSPCQSAREQVFNELALNTIDGVVLGHRSITHFEFLVRGEIEKRLEDYERNSARLEKFRLSQKRGENSSLVKSLRSRIENIRTGLTLNFRRFVRGLEAVVDTETETRHSVIKFIEWLILEVIGSFPSLEGEDKNEEFIRITSNGEFNYLMKELSGLDPRSANVLPSVEDFERVMDLRKKLLKKIEDDTVRERIGRMILARWREIYECCRRQSWFGSRKDRSTTRRSRASSKEE